MENGYRFLTQSDITSVDSAQQNTLGARGITADGRSFVYASINSTAATQVPGAVLVQATAPTNATGLALSATNTSAQLSSGSITLLVTNGATAVLQNQFADGFLEVAQTSGTGNGPIAYRIDGNTAAAASGVITIQLAGNDRLTNASALVAGTDTVSLTMSPWALAVASATAGLPVGVLRIQVPLSATPQFAWLQLTGECAILLDATTGGVTQNGLIYQSTTTAGTASKTAPTLANGVAAGIGKARFTANASGVVSTFLTIT